MATLGDGPQRLGDYWLNCQLAAYQLRDLLMELMLKEVEGKLEPKINVPLLRRDQLRIYALLGDPATQLRIPGKLKVQVEKEGTQWRWTVQRPTKARSLQISRWSPGQTMPKREPDLDQDQAEQLLADANATLAYQPVATLDSDTAWTGTFNQTDRLRFIVFAEDTWYAAVIDTSQP
jgi:hypothetical protein